MNIKLEDKYKKILIGLGILAIIIFIVFACLFISETVNLKKFNQGNYFYNKNDYQNAYYNYKRISFTSKYYAYSLLKQAKCAELLGDKKTEFDKYDLLVTRFSKSAFAAKALYRMAQIYFENEEYDKGEKIFRRLQLNFPKTEYAIASNYYMGFYFKEKIPTMAKKYFLNYLKNSPGGKFSSQICTEVLNFKNLTQYDYQLIGYAYLKNNDNLNAFNNLQKADLSKNWNHLVIASARLKKTPQLKYYFETGMKNYSAYVSSEDLNEAINTFVQYYGGNKENWESVLKFTTEYNTRGKDFILYRYSKFIPKENKETIYNQIYKNYPDGDFASDALWNLFWITYKKGQYNTAEKLAHTHLYKYPDTNATPQVLFWLGKIYKYNLKNSTKAHTYFNKLINEYPDNYYAFRASSLLDLTYQSWHTKKNNFIPENIQEAELPIDLLEMSAFDKNILHQISKCKDYELLEELRLNNKLVDSWINLQKNRLALSATNARDALNELKEKPDFSSPAYKLAYPIYYTDIINSYAQKNHLDSYLIASLIREESYFNKYAQSPVGARGLMQLMPDTASFIAQKYNIPFTNTYSLFDEKKNIELGTLYFKFVKSQLNKNDLYAVAAYNGGPGSVQSWRKNLQYNDFDEFIENIPYEETQNYIKKVYRSYWNYSNIYK